LAFDFFRKSDTCVKRNRWTGMSTLLDLAAERPRRHDIPVVLCAHKARSRPSISPVNRRPA
jgi:hypothetical protein